MNMKLLCAFLAMLIVVGMGAVRVHAEGLIVTDVVVPDLAPGEDAQIRVTVKNTFSDDVQDVSFNLNLQGLPLAIVGSSESSTTEIIENHKEDFVFRIRASSTAKPGDYQIPYTLAFGNTTKPKTGTIGIRIKGDVQIMATVDAENPVLHQKGKVTLKLINKGLADARYVSVTLAPSGFTLLSDQNNYIGDISANDFESASFDVVYTSVDPVVSARLEYRDFNNVVQTKTIALPIIVYTQEEAIQRGILAKSNAPLYTGVIVALVVLWLIWRFFARRRRMKRSMAAAR